MLVAATVAALQLELAARCCVLLACCGGPVCHGVYHLLSADCAVLLLLVDLSYLGLRRVDKHIDK